MSSKILLLIFYFSFILKDPESTWTIMNDNQSKDVEKNIRILSASSPTSLITTPEKQENINSTPCNISATKLSPPSNLPSNETESFILESGALMCAVTGTIPITGRPTSESPINYSGQQQNNCISRQNSLRVSTSKYFIIITYHFWLQDVY